MRRLPITQKLYPTVTAPHPEGSVSAPVSRSLYASIQSVTGAKP